MKDIWMLTATNNISGEKKFFCFTDSLKALEKSLSMIRDNYSTEIQLHEVDDVKELFVVSLQDYYINPGECHDTIYDNADEPKEIIQYYLKDLKEEGIVFSPNGQVDSISKDIACGEMKLLPEGDGSFIKINVEAFKSLNVSITKIPVLS